MFPVEPFDGVGVPNSGRLFVVKIYHLQVHKPLPGAGSVAFTHTLYVFSYTSPERGSDFIPFDLPDPLVFCPLLHSIHQEKLSPSGSIIGMFQVKLRGLPIEPFTGEGSPNTG